MVVQHFAGFRSVVSTGLELCLDFLQLVCQMCHVISQLSLEPTYVYLHNISSRVTLKGG